MAVLNVRLSESDEKIVKSLRRKGVAIADLIRDTLRNEDQRRKQKPRTAKDVTRIIKEIYERHPVPTDLPPREFDSCDRRSVRAYVVKRLKRKRSA